MGPVLCKSAGNVEKHCMGMKQFWVDVAHLCSTAKATKLELTIILGRTPPVGVSFIFSSILHWCVLIRAFTCNFTREENNRRT